MRSDVESAVRHAAAAHNIEAAALLSVVEVESSGDPFEPADGATPCFLFERHVFYKQLQQLAPSKLQAAVNQGLAHPDWRPGTQYKDQGNSTARMRLLARAAAIDLECAYRSASWGIGQTLGLHAEGLGYPSAQALVEAMKGNIPVQVEAMIGEINRSKLGDELASHNWAAFARVYNGPSYAKNAYDTRLARAYAKWSRSEEPPKPSDDIKWIQASLNKLGADPALAVNGFEDGRTHAAIIDFQEEHDLDADGIVGILTRAKITEELQSLEQENDPMSSWITSILLNMLGNAQVQSLFRKTLTVVGTALLVKLGLSPETAGSLLDQIITGLGGAAVLGTSFYLSAQNASDKIVGPTLVSQDAKTL